MPASHLRTGRKSWTNWHESVRPRIADLIDLHNPPGNGTPEDLRETTVMIQRLIADALAEGVRLRAYGGGWSLSRAPVTDGWMLNTRHLNWRFPVSAASLVPGRAGRAGEHFLVQCGCQISEVNRYLEREKGRSLRTSGASNGQTIGGAAATGTHGSAIDTGAIQDHVVGMHLITGPDRHVWLERASDPVASDALIASLGAEALRDDALFNAAVVGLGALGVVHLVMIETEPLFLLEAHRTRGPFTDGLKRAVTSLEFEDAGLPDPPSRPFFFQVVLNPHSEDRPAYVTTMYRRPFPAGRPIDYAISGGLGPGYELLGALGALTDKVPALTPGLVSQVTQMQQEPFTGRTGTLGETFDFSTPRSKAAGAAVAVPLARTLEALEVIGDVHRREGPAPVVFACRFVRRSKGALAFTRFERTCVIDLDGVASARTARFFKAVWQALDATGIPYTQHWGKMNGLDAEAVRRAYGDAADDWVAARWRLLPAPAERRLFSGPFLESLGLDG